MKKFLIIALFALIKIGEMHATETPYNSGSKNMIQLLAMPAQDLLFIETACPINNNASIYNISGEQLMNFSLKNGANSIEIKSLKKGIYFLKLQDSQYKETYKFVKN